MWFNTFITLYIIISLLMVLILFLNGVRPSKMLGWMLAIFTIPIGGVLLYLMIGRNKRKKRISRLKREIISPPETEAEESVWEQSQKHRKLMHLINKNCLLPPTSGNSLEILRDGKATFDSIFEALEKAEKFIHIEYYIIEEGDLTDKLTKLFKEKIAQGVTIRLIYDGVGSFALSNAYLEQLRSIGVEVHAFLPVRFGRYLSSLNNRNHRKIVVIDGLVGFTGGINVTDYYIDGHEELGKWHDLHLKITGPAAIHLNQVFLSDWYIVCETQLAMNEIPETPLIGTGVTVQIVYSGPDDMFPTIEQAYLSIINNTKNYVYITNPYIIPGPEILKALQVASLSGVDVRLLISKKSDIRLVKWTVRSYFEPLLKAGVRIFLYPEGFLHSKVIISDDNVATIGTANIDVRSFEHNYEVNAVIYDEEFTRLLGKEFQKDCAKSEELNYEAYLKRPVKYKIYEGAARLFSPLL